MNIERVDIGSRMSQVVVHGNTAYFAGMVADDPTGTVADQTMQVLAKIDHSPCSSLRSIDPGPG